MDSPWSMADSMVGDFGFPDRYGPNESVYEMLNRTRPEFLTCVPDHWQQQPKPTVFVRATISVVFSLLSIPGNASQILVLVAFLRCKKLRTASNKLLISLTLADLLLLSQCHLAVYQQIIGEPRLGCRTYGFFGTMASLAEIWSLSFVSLDRLRSIYYPLQTHKQIKSSQANIAIGFVWILAAFFAACPLLGWSNYVSESNLIGCIFDNFTPSLEARSYVIALLVIAWVIPMAIIVFSYVVILVSVRKSFLEFGARTREERIRRKMELTLAKMAFVLLMVWLIAWTPYALMTCWILFFDLRLLTANVALVPTLCCKLSAAVNSLMYGSRLPKFRREIWKLIRCGSYGKGHDSMDSNYFRTGIPANTAFRAALDEEKMRSSGSSYRQNVATLTMGRAGDTTGIINSSGGSPSGIKMNRMSSQRGSVENNVEDLSLDLARHDFMTTMLTSEPATFTNS